MVHALIVRGGGPAGLTAGIYARTRNLSTLILEAEQAGGQLVWLYPTKSVYDYPSYIAVEGVELAGLFVEHARGSGCEIRRGGASTTGCGTGGSSGTRPSSSSGAGTARWRSCSSSSRARGRSPSSTAV